MNELDGLTLGVGGESVLFDVAYLDDIDRDLEGVLDR